MELQNKTAVILGVADESSISWAIARRLMDHGARVFIGYQQKFFSRVRLLMQNNPGLEGARCDITNDDELAAFFAHFEDRPIDILVHGIAFGPPEVFTSPPSGINVDAFATTMNISTHSLLKTAGFAKPYLREWSSIMTLTYQASEQASPFYGLMGVAKASLECCVRYLAIEMGEHNVRVNAISPGPIETPAALGEMLAFLRNPEALATPAGAILRGAVARIQSDPALAGEDDQVKAKALWHVVQTRVAQECAIEQFITADDVADCALFLASDLAKKITGQIIRIDCGMSTSRLMPGGDAVPETPLPKADVAPAATPGAGGDDAANRAAAARPDAGAQIAAAVAYLGEKFPDCVVTPLEAAPDDRLAAYVLVDSAELAASLCLTPEFLALDPAAVTEHLAGWSTEEVLRAAGRSPIVAAPSGLKFAMLDFDRTLDRWTAEALVSPEYHDRPQVVLDFPVGADMAAFAASAGSDVVCDRGDGERDLVLRAPRGKVMALIAQAASVYEATPRPPRVPGIALPDA